MHICGNYYYYYQPSAVYPPFYTLLSKMSNYIYIDRLSGKLLPNANYGAAIYSKYRKTSTKISVHLARTLMTS